MNVNANVAAAQTALARQDAALGFVKQNADAASQISNVLAEGAENASQAASGGRGSIVNILV
jgi:hypothetical protein